MNSASARALLGWLLVLLVGVGASAWQLLDPPGAHGGRHDGHGHALEGGPQPLFSWQPDEARRIEVHAPGRSMDMVLTQAGWQGAPAGFDVEAFVALFSRARADRRFESSPGDDYGLEPGLMTFLVKDAGQRVLAGMIVGDILPDGVGRYVRGTTDSDVMIVPDYQVRPLLQAIASAPTGAQQAGEAVHGAQAAEQSESGDGALKESAPMAWNHVD